MNNDPLFIAPRFLSKSWGRNNLGNWFKGEEKPDCPIGEIWTLHSGNFTESGQSLGRLIADAPTEMLGDLGRAPPTLRLVATAADTGGLSSDATALWRVLEAKPTSTIEAVGAAEGGWQPSKQRCKAGETYRVAAGGALGFGEGIVAVEARPNFRPCNADISTPSVARLSPVAKARVNDARVILLQEPGLSVEVWTLPERSRLRPDGETCHAMMALSPGIMVDGRPIAKGEVVFIPAHGKELHLTGSKAQALVVYPDDAPTSIWRLRPQPDPGAAALRSPAHVNIAFADAMRSARHPGPSMPARLAA